VLGPKFSAKERKALNLSAITQVEYSRHLQAPLSDPQTVRAQLSTYGRSIADKIAVLFGTRLSRRQPGKHASVINWIEHGHRVYAQGRIPQAIREILDIPAQRVLSDNLKDLGLPKVSTISMRSATPAVRTRGPIGYASLRDPTSCASTISK
jgi:hypothetical protein